MSLSVQTSNAEEPASSEPAGSAEDSNAQSEPNNSSEQEKLSETNPSSDEPEDSDASENENLNDESGNDEADSIETSAVETESEDNQEDANDMKEAPSFSQNSVAAPEDSAADSANAQTGQGGDGGNTGNAGDGGGGGEGSEGGITGNQSATTTSSSEGGNGGNGGAASAPSLATTTLPTATTTATTTDSHASFATSTATDAITTGDAIAHAKLLNVLNTNLVNSYGELLFLSNMFAESVDKVDFRMLSLFGLSRSGDFMCLVCTGSTALDLALRSHNQASTTNNLSAEALTGDNALSTSGEGYISTGNAYAAGDIINFVNNNFVDSNYLFLTYNNFGDWGGDIVFPNANTFFNVFGESLPSGLSEYLVDSDNLSEAEVVNALNISASSSDNSLITTGGGGSIHTGNASTAVNTLNLLNSSFYGGASLNILFKVHGNWSGKVYGLPPGVSMNETDGGFTLSYETAEELVGEGRLRGKGIDVNAINSASIENSMDIHAATDGNILTANEGSIETGDAYAAANVINVANTNMIGRNMFWAIVNIFGDWDGDVSFGKPDLWIGGHAEMEGTPLRPGQKITYHLTVMNNGDIAAEDTELLLDLGSEYLSSDKTAIDIGTLSPGESRSYDLSATLSADMPHVSQSVTTIASVRSAQKDDNVVDNEEQITFSIDNEQAGGGNRRGRNSSERRGASATTTAPAATSSPLRVAKFHDSPAGVNAGNEVNYTITVYNDSDTPFYETKLADRLTGTTGELLNEEIWDLGTIRPHEEITLTYSVLFAENSPSGIYANQVRVSALTETAESLETADQIWSNVASAAVLVIAVPRPLLPPLPAEEPKTEEFATSTDSIEEELGENSIIQEVRAAGDKGLLAAAFFATPTGKQLTVFTLILAGLVLLIMGIRRRYYSR